jgi:hypothetical protein
VRAVEPAHVTEVPIESEKAPLGFFQIDDARFNPIWSRHTQEHVLWIKAVVRQAIHMNLSQQSCNGANNRVTSCAGHYFPFTSHFFE